MLAKITKKKEWSWKLIWKKKAPSYIREKTLALRIWKTVQQTLISKQSVEFRDLSLQNLWANDANYSYIIA